MDTFTIDPGAIGAELDRAFSRLDTLQFAEALWSRRLDIWTTDLDVQQKIGGRLGWLDAVEFVSPQLDRVRAFASAIGGDGFSDVVLLGMGGSSLAPEVMRQVFGVEAGYPRFRMLDSVDPAAVRDAMSAAATSLFVLASKSGTTIEPNVMANEARRRVEEAGHSPWGSRFVAITDQNTVLHARAQAERFRDIFVNPADIGGRYSALSLFGLVPAALMGADVDRLVAAARTMAEACRTHDVRRNPGLALGAVMAAAAEAGRDKLTLVVPDRLASFGLWVEQLVAESTGKKGKGVVPITGETPEARYGADRAAVVIELGNERPDPAVVERLRATGAPVVTLRMPDALSLGAEFFRWEVATAAAGLLLGINPFDEPNVQQAKDATRALLDTYTAQGSLPEAHPHASQGGIRLTLTGAAQERLDGDPSTFLRLLGRGDYFGLLAYVPPGDPALESALARLRDAVAQRTGCATMFGYGPRYLHSTGQLHKGGAPNGVFIVVTAPPSEDLAIPGEPYSFGVLETAQALGDFASLERTGRRALHVRLAEASAEAVTRAADLLLKAV